MPDIKGTSLPRDLNRAVREDVIRAYEVCLRCEEGLIEELKAGRDIERDLINCRIVGYLFHHSPTDEALETVVNEVLSCVNHEDLLRVGRMYFEYLLKPFYLYTVDGEGDFPSAFTPSDDAVQRVMNETPRDGATAHNKALVRDGFRCVLTGGHDSTCMRESKALREKFPSNDWARDWEFTVCAYIIKKVDSGSGFHEEYAATVHAVLERFGYTNLLAELKGAAFHRLENVITLSIKILSWFDEMLFWFVETTEPHTYKVKTGSSLNNLEPLKHGLPDYVTFTTPNEEKLPLPSPTYLKLHAAVCEVGELSGATDYMEQFHMDMENLLVGDSMEDIEEEALSRAFSHAI